MASAIAMKCSKNFEAMSSVAGLSRASSSAMESIVAQKKAIQAVPSACWRWPPPGSGLRPVEDADVVEPEEAAREEIAAFEVLPVDRKSTRLNSSHLGISYAVF